MACRCGQAGCVQDLDPDTGGRARESTPFRPDPARPFDSTWQHIHAKPDADAYPFLTGPRTADCPTCKGTGEVVDYPPDDDERLIACGHCGGTGELTR